MTSAPAWPSATSMRLDSFAKGCRKISATDLYGFHRRKKHCSHRFHDTAEQRALRTRLVPGAERRRSTGPDHKSAAPGKGGIRPCGRLPLLFCLLLRGFVSLVAPSCSPCASLCHHDWIARACLCQFVSRGLVRCRQRGVQLVRRTRW